MQTLSLLSVNLGEERPDPRNPQKSSGIYKIPVSGPVNVTPLGLERDVIIAVKHHGGPDQAVYLYSREDYAWWEEQLGRPLPPGTFGENLTLQGFESAQLRIGDVFQLGPVTLQVTAPRIPCETFAWRMGDPYFVKKFRQAERPGAYCRVLQPGSLQAGVPAAYHPSASSQVSLLDLYHDHYEPGSSPAQIQRLLAAPISIRARQGLEKRLAALNVIE